MKMASGCLRSIVRVLDSSPLPYSSDVVSLCFRLRSLVRSCLDCSCSISALARYFHTSIASWSDPAPFRVLHTHNLSIAFWSDLYQVVSNRPRDETTEIAATQLKCDGYTYKHTYIQTQPDYTAQLVASC